jgi:hypothetical protein
LGSLGRHPVDCSTTQASRNLDEMAEFHVVALRTAIARLRVLGTQPLLVTVVGVYALQCFVAGALTVFRWCSH